MLRRFPASRLFSTSSSGSGISSKGNNGVDKSSVNPSNSTGAKEEQGEDEISYGKINRPRRYYTPVKTDSYGSIYQQGDGDSLLNRKKVRIVVYRGQNTERLKDPNMSLIELSAQRFFLPGTGC